ncbi:hypothetical protein MAR_004635 [Mya arenaria]|uniref:Uncharacterized protein n=1 Tax=Mya arenaria TaxID=6604 RepID=A0ABY7EYS6_MYAAR|nr:hypothetical protein MAR_004635 [Mya arenaria]
MNSKGVVVLLVCCLLAVQLASVNGNCYRYVCKRRCQYTAPNYDEYAFRYLWPLACGRRAVDRWGVKACCRTMGRY